jgi:hypothetical protein
MWRRRKPTPHDPPVVPGCEIAQECELFLDGRYVEHLRKARRPIPAWVRLNPVAHGTVDDLRQLVSVAAHPSAQWDWVTATGRLAGEVLNAVEGDAERLRCLQREILIPLELGLADEWFRSTNAIELVRLVEHELRRD